MITVFADQYLYKLADYMPQQADLHFFDPAGGLPSDADTMDALLIRTVTPINEESLSRLPENLQFVATGSVGTDHVDTGLLAQKNIAFADAAGCNAQSVAEYVATALLIWAEEKKVNLSQKSVGIVGVGHVGSKVHRLLDKLHIKTVLYDPPRKEREESFFPAGLKEVLSADILTFHTPFTKTGKYPTYHWLNEEKLAGRTFDFIINTARGGVVNEKALYKAYTAGQVKNFVLDVWEGEPIFNDLLAKNAYIKTPHIAGYSKQAKLRASQRIAEALCKHFSLKTHINSIDKIYRNRKSAKLQNMSANLADVLTNIHPIREYEKNLTTLIGIAPKEKGKQFNKLRATLPLRDEYQFITIPKSIYEAHSILRRLGFQHK